MSTIQTWTSSFKSILKMLYLQIREQHSWGHHDPGIPPPKCYHMSLCPSECLYQSSKDSPKGFLEYVHGSRNCELRGHGDNVVQLIFLLPAAYRGWHSKSSAETLSFNNRHCLLQESAGVYIHLINLTQNCHWSKPSQVCLTSLWHFQWEVQL